jgi:thymidylate kinase
VARRRTTPRPLLIAAEGLDGAGKSAHLDLLARWLERKGRSVAFERWEPSSIVDEAAGTTRLRAALTPRVAALLTAAEAARRLEVEVREPLTSGAVVLADRYVWTAIAREAARGLDPAWVTAMYRFAPPPDLVLFFDQSAAAALGVALERHGPAASAAAISAAFAPFLERMIDVFDRLVEGAGDASFGPWSVPVVRIDPQADRGAVASALRAAVRPLLVPDRAAA